MQQLQNEIILIIEGAGHVDTRFLQQDGACPHTVNIILDGLHDLFGRHTLSDVSRALQV
jgi:hypothetical protein